MDESQDETQSRSPSFLNAYKDHKKVAECLFKNSMYRNAYLSLLIASECLLKGIFNCIKNEIFGDIKNKKQARIAVEAIIHNKNKNQEFLPEKSFGHDLNYLKTTIKDLFEEFERGQFQNDFAQFTKRS